MFDLQNGTFTNWTDDRCVINITLILTQYHGHRFLSMLFRLHHIWCITTADIERSNITDYFKLLLALLLSNNLYWR